MDWQLPLTLIVLAAACGYLAWRGWRAWRAARSGCSGGCGCGKTSAKAAEPADAFIPAEQVTIRRGRLP